ncbi:MAG TPA: HemK family protein methyltransferase [Actinomycetota bacterium]|nr:HemK family protein methyltransferase [Actinomycetota bacterium]
MESPEVVDALRRAGCVSPAAEAAELQRAARERSVPIEELVARRVVGEPLAWIVGHVTFLDLRVRVTPGVFVPRPHTELLARRAIELLPSDGIGVDLCTGCGAVAAAMRAARPDAAVHATDVDPVAVACARTNGVDAVLGDLDAPLPPTLRGHVDVVTAVVPYVPTEELPLLPRDVLAHEPRRALDGGPGGTLVLRRAAPAAARLLRPGGAIVLELGGDQAGELSRALEELGFSGLRVLRDADGRARAIEAHRRDEAGTPRPGRSRSSG